MAVKFNMPINAQFRGYTPGLPGVDWVITPENVVAVFRVPGCGAGSGVFGSAGGDV
jgi:hypothetical protein